MVVARDERRPRSPTAIRARFDHVLVDEYQDTNALQAEIVVDARRRPARGVTAVGDDAQAIYSFRAATVHNILEFPIDVRAARARWSPLEDNYRSTVPIVAAANAVIERSPQRHAKTLRSSRAVAASGRRSRSSRTSSPRSTT